MRSEISLQANGPLQFESWQSAPSQPQQDASSKRRTWFLLGFGISGLVLFVVALHVLPGRYTLMQRQPSQRTNGLSPSETKDAILVQGGSLRTWTYSPASDEQVQVMLSSVGQPLDAEMELWNGPENTHTNIRMYTANGLLRPFHCVVQTPGGLNKVTIRNAGKTDVPIIANILHNDANTPTPNALAPAITLQRSSFREFPIGPEVDSIQVLLKTDGHPLNARLELRQGSNDYKHMIMIDSKNGLDQPFFAMLETPGSGNVIRIINNGLQEMPMTASVVPTPPSSID